MRKLQKIFILIPLLILASCAAIPSEKEIEITSVPPNAYVYVDGWILKTPAKVTLKNDRSHVIKVKKEGYKDSEVNPEISIRYGVVFGANLIWTFVYPVAVLIDFTSGHAFGIADTHIILEENK